MFRERGLRTVTRQHEKILRGVRAFSPLLQAYEAGFTPDQIKRMVMGTLLPEFENASVLDRYGIDLLTAESVNVQRVLSQQWSAELYDACMRIRRRCLAANQEECARVCSMWLEPISDSLALYWSAVRLEHVKIDLPLNDFAYEIFRNIGSLIEGTLQTYLKEMLHVTKVLAGETVSFEEVNLLSLGTLVQQFGDAADVKNLLALPPWRVPLNQWRNIAQHYSLKADAATIRCTYGARNSRTVELTREELLEVARGLFLLYSSFRTSHTIFFLDNADALAAHCNPFARNESDKLFQFTVGAASQGFEVTALEVSEKKAIATLVDVCDAEDLERAVHASQFTYQLWVATKAEEVQVEYRSKFGRHLLRSFVRGVDCEKVFSGEEELPYLAKVAIFRHQEHNKSVEPTR
jgi:hypothetical protein